MTVQYKYPDMIDRKYLGYINVFNPSIVIGLILLTACQHRDPGTFEVERSKEGLLLKENDVPVLFYRTASDGPDKYISRNNYIHPLYSLSGDTLTEDFPADHEHHRGIFWAWHQVWLGDQRMGDSWTYENFLWDIREITTDLGERAAVVNVNTLWKSAFWKDATGRLLPLAEEQVKLTILPASRRSRTLLFEITITSLNDSLGIGGAEDAKGYGGFSWRVQLPEQVVFTGTDGIVTPTTHAVEAGPWIHMYGRQPETDKKYGLLVMSHPGNPGNPGQWILREQKSMQNAVFPGRIPVVLNNGERFRLNYCMVIYEGVSEDVVPDQHYREYLQEVQGK